MSSRNFYNPAFSARLQVDRAQADASALAASDMNGFQETAPVCFSIKCSDSLDWLWVFPSGFAHSGP